MQRIFVVLVASILLSATSVQAQTFPTKPLRLLVGYAPGGGADILARLLGVRMADSLGQPVVIDNRPGAGGTIATNTLARSNADGHTLYFSDAAFVTAPSIYAKLPYDTLNDIAAVAYVAALPLAFCAPLSLPAKTPQELIALLKSNPEKFSYGSPGVGTLHHLTSELLKIQTGIKVTHVPYKGAAPLLSDLMGGQIPLGVTSATAALAQVKSNRLRIIGVTSRERIVSAPDIPTMAEAVPGFEVNNDLFILAPAGTPRAAITTLSGALRTILAQKDIQEGYLSQGAIARWSSPADLTARIQKDVPRWRSVAKDAGILPQ